MGLLQSHAEFFQPTQRLPSESSAADGIDPLELLYRVERTLWRVEPAWLKPRLRGERVVEDAAIAQRPEASPRRSKPTETDCMQPMSASQAMALVPSLMDEKWVAPLVALIDSVDVVIQSTGLALLSRIVRSAEAEEVFIKVSGITKVMALLEVEASNVRYLALEVIHALCSRHDRIVAKFNDRGLVQHLARLASLDEGDPKTVETILASLRVLRLILPHKPVKAAVGPCRILPLLLKLSQSSQATIANVAVLCVGLTLPDPVNMAEIIQLGCIEELLRLVLPSNTHAHAVVQALSVIADQDVSLFPKELTLLTVSKTLDTLRGGAKRSKMACTSAYLFASLSRSPVLRHGLCTEGNLAILSKLLVGGSTEVLKAATFALGMAAFEGSNAAKEILFQVDAPDYLLKLLDHPVDDELAPLLLFALASILDPVLVLSSGRYTDPTRANNCSEPLRQRMRSLSNNIASVGLRCNTIFRYCTGQVGCASSFAAKILCSMCMIGDVRLRVAESETSVNQMIVFMRDAEYELLSSLLLFFIECSSPFNATSSSAQPTGSAKFCGLVSNGDNQLVTFLRLFDCHTPLRLLGLLAIFTHFASQSASLRSVLSGMQVFDRVLDLLTKVNDPILHLQALTFLEEITRDKNRTAIANVFAQSPDRIANLVHSTHADLLKPTLNVLRRLFKYHNAPDTPSSGARRQLVTMLGAPDLDLAVQATRVWGNMLLHRDKQQSFALLPNAVEALLRLIRRSHDDLRATLPRNAVKVKNCRVAIRALSRSVVDCGDMKKETASAPSFLSVFDLFEEEDEAIMGFAVHSTIQIAEAPALRKYIVVPAVMERLAGLLRDRDPARISPVYRIAWLKFVSVLGKRDPRVQCLLAEFRVVDAILLLIQSPAATLDLDVLKECMDALAWLCTGDAAVRKQIASTSKLVDLALRYIDCQRETLVTASLHLLQRITTGDECDEVKNKIRVSRGIAVVMRAVLSTATTGGMLKTRACALVRNLVVDNAANRGEFQRVGFNAAVVRLVASRDCRLGLKLQIRGLQAITAMCTGSSAAAKASKQEALECDFSQDLLQLVVIRKEVKLCHAWCEAMASLAQGSSHNQKKLVDGKLVIVVIRLISYKDSPAAFLQVAAARLFAFMASLPTNRATMMDEGGEKLLEAIIAGLQSEVHDLQRYIALAIAHLATRSDAAKVRIGAGGTASCLVDRLSSKQLNVVENVLQAIAKLGSHAGNKVKFGSRLCFEKLLSLVHHDELTIRKGAVSAIAVLIEGNDANKKFLLQCEASVVTELCALMKSSNGKIVESAMLILGELSQLADQTLEISKFIDIVAIVRMIEHVNPRIRRAALHTVLNLTKESFNKLRFGIQECVDAMLACLQSEDMLIVELATTCLANLSFLDANASKIAKLPNSIGVLLKLAAASTTSRDYLSWNEARALGLGKEPSPLRTSPKGKSTSSPSKVSSRGGESLAPTNDPQEVDEEELDDKLEPFVYSPIQEGAADIESAQTYEQQVLDFSSFPTRQTAVLEQALLVISNCAGAYHNENAVEKVAVKVVCQALGHPSELVKRCACYILGVWCKKDAKNQRITTKQGILPVLIQLLNSPNLNVVEAATYLLGKLAYFGDNHMRFLQLDLLTTLVQTILRKPANLSHEGLMDRTIRLLGTLVRFPRVRLTIKSEEIIADILTQLLQIHRVLAKNTSRLILGMLEEDSLRFFLPKKTVMILRIFLTDDHGTAPKTVRNILSIFQSIATVEEHKITIALEDSGEAVTRMIQELCPSSPNVDRKLSMPEYSPNASTVLSLLACISSTRKIVMILHEKDLYGLLSLYIATLENPAIDTTQAENPTDGEQELPARRLYATRPMVHDALVIARHMCAALGDRAGTRLSHANFARLIVELLRVLAGSPETPQLIPEYFESFCVLDRLSTYSRDQQSFAEDYAVEVVHHFLQQWIAAADRDGTIEGRQADKNAIPFDLVAYVAPLLRVLLRMAEHHVNRVLLVRTGGIPLVLQCLPVIILTDDLRLLLARALRHLCGLPAASEWFDTQDVVMPLFRFMHMHRHQEDLRLYCLGCLADILETSVLSRRHVIGQPQVLRFLLECLQNAVDEPADKVHFAINALECLSMEPELAVAMAQLGDGLLELVPNLLLVPTQFIARSTQYFAIEMIGYLASYGHADKLGLSKVAVERIIQFLDFQNDDTITGEAIALALWALAHLVRHQAKAASSTSAAAMASSVMRWVTETEGGIDKIVRAGLTPSEQLGTTASVTANTLTVLLAACTAEGAAATVDKLVKRNRCICSALSAHLEAVEREVNLPTLRLLAICMAAINFDEDAATRTNESGIPNACENWSTVFRHLMEWMEVYARDPQRCPGPSLSDAFVCLSHITSVEALATEFRACINRSGLAEIVGNAITFLDPKRGGGDQEPKKAEVSEDNQEHERRQILLNALKICGNLMEFTPAYSERFFLLSVPQSIENVLMVDDDELIMESLTCMSLLADWSSSRQLLFSSLRCMRRLSQLLRHHDMSILAKITPLLVLMCSRIPALPGLCTPDGIIALCERLAAVLDWKNRDRYTTRVSEDCATILLSLFSNEESIYGFFAEVDVIGRMFEIVLRHDAPELPLRILTKISGSAHSHRRFLQLLESLCGLLQGTTQQLAGSAQHLVLCILFNLFCRNDDPDTTQATLTAGEIPLLHQLLPLSRWIQLPNVASVRIAIKILHTYVGSPGFRTLLNNGKNVPALLKLVGDASDDVSGAAAQLLLTAISEREVEIAVTVEDGIAVLVRTLQKTSKWHLQCLLLSILRNMCHDSEIPVLIMKEDGVSRLVHFIRERKGVLFAADERLAHACKILKYVSAAAIAGAATRIVESRGHIRVIELSTYQESSVTNDSERATTMEILSNLAATGEVAAQLTESKLHDHCLKWVLASPSQGDKERESMSQSRKLALHCLRSMCKYSKSARQDVSVTKLQLVDQLEKWLLPPSPDRSVVGVTTHAMAVLMYMSKTQAGRHAIFARSSPEFTQRVCAVLLCEQTRLLESTPRSEDAQTVKSSTLSVLGVKLLGNLLSDLTPERFRVSWACGDLTKLLPLLQRILGDHQQPRLQLHALNLLSGSFDGDFSFPVSSQMLSDLFNLLLISPTARHSQQAEHIIIKAFEREDQIQLAIGGNQILEQLLIVFTQRAESQQHQQEAPQQPQRRPLAPALTQVLNVSISRGFIVHPRFTSKIVTLLCTSPLASKAETVLSDEGTASPRFSNASTWSSEDEDEDALASALGVYLALVFYASNTPGVKPQAAMSPFQLSIRDALKSEVNAPALTAIMLMILVIHEQTCASAAATQSSTEGERKPVDTTLSSGRNSGTGPREITQRDVLLWSLFADCLRESADRPQSAHVVTLLQEVPHELWLCLLKDMFSKVEAVGESEQQAKRIASGIVSTSTAAPLQATTKTLHTLEVIASCSRRAASSEARQLARVSVGSWCLQSILAASSSGVASQSSAAVIDAALRALASVRVGWSDELIVQTCQCFDEMARLIPYWLAVFRTANRDLEDARVMSLQLLLLLVSSGSYVEELKAADIRGAIENNELIPAAHKSLPISILSLLGYNADLNVEFQLALERFVEADALSQRKESLSYLSNFLQLYTLTDEALQERAIDCFMSQLVAGMKALSQEAKDESSDEIMVCIREYLSCLGKLSRARKFVELYRQRWNTNALVSVCFSRRRAINSRGIRECAVLSHAQITDGLDVCARLMEELSPTTSAGTLSDTSFLNAMALLDDMPPDQMPLCERVVAVFAWGVENEDTFDLLCMFAARLRSVLRFITSLSDVGMQSLLTILDALTKRVSEIELLGELLTELLTCVYRNAGKLKNAVREKMLLYILMVLKRMGDEDLTACIIYEQSIQVILANVHVPAEKAARCSWDLLGVLSELDAAVVAIFNFDGIQIMLKEFCGPTTSATASMPVKTPPASTSPVRRVLSTRKSALSATDRAASAVSAAAAGEATYRRMEALKCLSKAARNHNEVLQKIGEMPGIGSHLFRVLAGTSAGSEGDSALATTSVNQEHAAHLIARIASQELFRASLLSQDHVSTLIESLESVHPNIVMYALEALFYLSEFAMCLDALVRHATVPVLAQILVSPLVEDGDATSEKTELFVLGLLANMCAKSKVIGRRVVSSNLLPRLRNYLASPHPQMQLYAAWVVKSVSKDSELVAKLHEQRIADVVADMLLGYEPIKTQRKAFGALANMISGHRPGTVFVDSGMLRYISQTIVRAMHPLVVSSQPNAHLSLARALTVLEAIASLSQVEKDMLCDDDDEVETRAIALTLQLLDSSHSVVKLKALQVVSRWVEENSDRTRVRQLLLVEAPLLSLVRNVSDERGECLLVALTLLNALLAIDDELKSKLAAMTNEVLLRLLPTLVPSSHTGTPLNSMQLRALNEALKSLVAMARSVSPSGGGSKLSGANPLMTLSAAIANALDPLVELLRLSTASDSLRLNALYLLVNFAGSSVELRPHMLTNGTMVACIRMLMEPHDDKLLQLCLLGMALLTGTGVDFSSVVPELLEVVDVLLRCLTSKNASVQANAVWVVSNICTEERLKAAIAGRGGATTLQAILSETLTDGAAASQGPGLLVANGHSRPPSSSQRIREYAPKAIKSLGFAPMATGPSGLS